MKAHPLLVIFVWWWIMFTAYTGTFKIALPAYSVVPDTREVWLEAKILGQKITEFHVTYPWWADATVGFPLVIFLLLFIAGKIRELDELDVKRLNRKQTIEFCITFPAGIGLLMVLFESIPRAASVGFLGSMIHTTWKGIVLVGTLATVSPPIVLPILALDLSRRLLARKRRSP